MDKGYKIKHSNLCSEIMLSNDENESFVCNLSSMNLEKWDEWKDTDAVETLVFFLDAVMTEFINKTEAMKFMEAPRNFAINQRALGIGVVGWHSLLQSKMIPFESMEAKYLNTEIWKTMRLQADEATGKLCHYLGAPPLLRSYGRRNVTTLAVAVGEEAGTLEEVYEPFLIQQGFLQRTPRGRIATPLAYRHVGITIPSSHPTLFSGDSAAAALMTASTQRTHSSCHSGIKEVSIAIAVPPFSVRCSST
jgi:hypothetical protein